MTLALITASGVGAVILVVLVALVLATIAGVFVLHIAQWLRAPDPIPSLLAILAFALVLLLVLNAL